MCFVCQGSSPDVCCPGAPVSLAWSGWAPWSSWSQCSARCGGGGARHGEKFSEKCEKKFILSRKFLGTISPCDQEAEIMRGSRLPGTEVAAEAL